jgi:hypothetical protein
MTQAGANSNFDAERMVEEIKTGDEKMPQVDVASDYELSKQFDVAAIDHTGEGEKAAEEATSPNLDISKISSQSDASQATEGFSDADPAAFLDMAKDVNPRL